MHFEMVPDRLPEALREVIAKFPPGALQFEVGIQTFDDATSQNISRRQNVAKLEENLRFLREDTGVHVHADLIAGLPGEDLASFGRGFDRLVALGRRRFRSAFSSGCAARRSCGTIREWGMVYSPQPPYEILQNKLLDFATMQRLRRFARYWDLIGNSGNFVETTPLLWGEGSAFRGLMAFADWLAAKLGKLHSIALVALAENLFLFLTTEAHLPPEVVRAALERDWHGGVKRERLHFLEPAEAAEKVRPSRAAHRPARQERHLAQR